MIFRYQALICVLMVSVNVFAQDYRKQYEDFKKRSSEQYVSFRQECNQKYVEFLKSVWEWYEGKSPLLLPKEQNPIPPSPFVDKKTKPIESVPVKVEPIENIPQPMPIEPIHEVHSTIDEFALDFFGAQCVVRMPELAKIELMDCCPNAISNAWKRLSTESMNNAIRDCLENRLKYSLCDWAYLLFLDKLSRSYCLDRNGATLVMAFLYCQSGYQMRLAMDGQNLVMMYGSKFQIFDKGYFEIDGVYFYPYGETSNRLCVCDAAFEGESPLSLVIGCEPQFGKDMTSARTVKSEQFTDVQITSRVPKELIKFYSQYPTSTIGGNPMTRWAMYANTSLNQETKCLIYPLLKMSIESLSEFDAVGRLLNLVQTGFVYECDDKVWGHDRAFFAEETLYYPYSDCEDRSILFSRLVRDLIDLDVALIYYPGHLSTAVCFSGDVVGDSMIIDGRKFVICDPTYIGAPVGAQMPNLEYDKAMAILLSRK